MHREEIIELLHRTGALIPGHFTIRDGSHTCELMRPAKAVQFAPFNRKLCFEIVRHFLELDIHVVVSPSIGGIPVAVEVGRQLEARAIFLEEIEGTSCLSRGFEMHEGERVVVVNDLLDSDSLLQPAITAIRNANARLIGIGGIIDVRTSDRSFNVKNVAAVRLAHKEFSPADCPLCAQGVPLSD
jgi:orotate phosphoribosyltransferase